MSTDATNVGVAFADERVAVRCAESNAPPPALPTVRTSEAAMNGLCTGGVDVLVLSRLLPDHGAEALRRAVRHRDLSCRVVMVDDERDIDRLDADIDARLARPFTADDLRGVDGTLDTPTPPEPRGDPHAGSHRRGEAS